MAAAALVFGNSFRVSFRAVVLQLTRRSYWLIKTRLNNNVFSQFERGKTHLNAERPITSVNLCLGGRRPTAEGLSVGSPTFEMTMASSAGEVKKKKESLFKFKRSILAGFELVGSCSGNSAIWTVPHAF